MIPDFDADAGEGNDCGGPLMMPDNSVQLANTRVKLQELQARYDALRIDQSEDPRVRRLTMMSLKRLINQLTEEMTRIEARPHRV